MTPDELYKLARESGERVTLVRPRGLVKGVPRGELLQENFNGTDVRSYKSASFIQWLEKNDLLSAGKEPDKLIPCACGDSYPSQSYGAGFIHAIGHCPNCDAAGKGGE
jgi:hypothetical protein